MRKLFEASANGVPHRAKVNHITERDKASNRNDWFVMTGCAASARFLPADGDIRTATQIT
jgi:hypothetical protein